jgi:hypothetical protein
MRLAAAAQDGRFEGDEGNDTASGNRRQRSDLGALARGRQNVGDFVDEVEDCKRALAGDAQAAR